MSESTIARRLRRSRPGLRFCSGWGGLAALLTIAAAVYLPSFFTIPAVDRDEARFAQASRQMVEGAGWRSWVIPRVQDRPRLNKPPLIYWLQAGATRCVLAITARGPDSDAIWMYRLPSLLAAVGIVALTWRLGLRMFDARAAWLGACMIALSPVFFWEARQARADMVLVFFTTMALLGLWRVFQRGARGDRGGAVLLWAGMLGGVMTKGPITPMIVLLAAAGASLATRRWVWLARTRPIVGLLVLIAGVAPWVALVAREIGFGEYVRIVSGETVGRSLEARESHAGLPGYHAVLMPVLLGAGSLFAGLGLRRAWKVARGDAGGDSVGAWKGAIRAWRGRAGDAFCLCAVAPAWILFEAVRTKLPHYTMPLYPPLALLSARALLASAAARSAWGADRSRLARIGAWVWIVLVAGVALAACALVGWTLHRGAHPTAAVLYSALGVIGVAALIGACTRWTRGRRWPALQIGGLTAFAIVELAVGVSLADLDDVRTSQRVALELHVHDPSASRPIAAVGYTEDTLIFETHGRANRMTEQELPAWLAPHPSALIVCTAEELPRLGLRELARVRGFNYSKGKWVEVIIGEPAR